MRWEQRLFFDGTWVTVFSVPGLFYTWRQGVDGRWFHWYQQRKEGEGMMTELHMKGTIREHYFHPDERALAAREVPVCEKCIEVMDDRAAVVLAPFDAPAAIGVPRVFETGATRDSERGKYDYEGFLSPAVIARFGEYMHKHRYQADGSLRDSDNWQKGIPLNVYIKSAWRHFLDWWLTHRGLNAKAELVGIEQDVIEDALCGLLFNVQGYLHEVLKARSYGK